MFHLGRNDAAAGVVHLADVLPRLGAEDLAADVGEGGDAAAAVGTELAVVLGPHLALGDLLDVAAAADPAGADLGEAGVDVDGGIDVGVGAAGVIDADGGLARIDRKSTRLNSSH